MLTDLYELTMLESYFREGMNQTAVFDLFVRRFPANRDYLVAAGLEHVLDYLEGLSFSAEAIEYLRSLDRFSAKFLNHLGELRFSGDVYAVPEGTVVFPNEPIVVIIAPLPEAQLAETFVMNQIHLATMAASKASRVVQAARGRSVVDFGLRRMHGADAGLKEPRAFYIAGVDSTSSVLAGHVYGIPVAGTMAHSYIQAFDDEKEAFQRFLQSYPQATLLVDTYDTLQGVRKVIELAHEMGSEFRADGVRLDSGDLEMLAKETRKLFDEAGLHHLKIFASSSLDEYEIETLLAAGAPIDGFGVGTHMSVSSDAPSLDTAYKLAEYAGKPRLKLSTNKITLPGRKQVFRQSDHDVIALSDESLSGERLLSKVMEGGRRIRPFEGLEACRARCQAQLEKLSTLLPYRVDVSEKLTALSHSLGSSQKLNRTGE
jgi:nicotinate phosphoribosyltransferase